MHLHDIAAGMDAASNRAKIDAAVLRTAAADIRKALMRADAARRGMRTDRDAQHLGGAIDRATSAADTLDRLARNLDPTRG